jgi:ElaB/YqjD/DUF883 family membrane-anchored ribosome-binding protein
MAESTAKGDTKSDRDAVRDDVEQLRADLDALRGDLSKLTESLTGKVERRAKDEVEAIRQRIDALARETKASGQQGIRAVEEQIDEHPFMTLATAFAIGLMVGRFFDRR